MRYKITLALIFFIALNSFSSFGQDKIFTEYKVKEFSPVFVNESV